MGAPLREQLQEYLYNRRLTLEENIVVVITHDRVIHDNLKKRVRNQTLCTCKLFLLT